MIDHLGLKLWKKLIDRESGVVRRALILSFLKFGRASVLSHN